MPLIQFRRFEQLSSPNTCASHCSCSSPCSCTYYPGSSPSSCTYHPLAVLMHAKTTTAAGRWTRPIGARSAATPAALSGRVHRGRPSELKAWPCTLCHHLAALARQWRTLGPLPARSCTIKAALLAARETRASASRNVNFGETRPSRGSNSRITWLLPPPAVHRGAFSYVLVQIGIILYHDRNHRIWCESVRWLQGIARTLPRKERGAG